ncbi:TfoX/Sxy family DNA transformation protein [Kiloniella sp. EL199]|uniref:TfoX/Sxy family DNA transformation protein n=1 Tax=Kiloniella sp. EL199 TaxID=2107581 RepID=UPI000EA184F1|nr:TfoX/Sxy family DNA transformation protein [Kiloniella sp. EL199]
MSRDPKEDLLALKNLGPKSVAQLADIGITSSSHLIELGAEEVFRRLYFRFCDEHRLSVNYLYALEGAIKGCDWRLIPMERKQELKNLLKDLKS